LNFPEWIRGKVWKWLTGSVGSESQNHRTKKRPAPGMATGRMDRSPPMETPSPEGDRTRTRWTVKGPGAMGGNDEVQNLQPLCGRCNREKGDRFVG